uniref:Reverse transcriptase domain-containing protein n=1 Tax=Tanacetum cinerariifolium TaxID=118510 RepID=A0A699GL34_TANCI|nr:hypothetical protein [Tanacetum cinerariifolium]
MPCPRDLMGIGIAEEDTFFENENDDAHDHVERVLDIVNLFNIPGVTHDAVMMRFFPLHSLELLKGGWIDFPQEPSIPGISLKKLSSKGNVRHPRPLSSLKTSITSSRKGPILGMTPAQALTAIHTMTDHSQKWHDDLGASVNVIPTSVFEHLKISNLNKIDMLVEMADMTKRTLIGMVENILVKIDKFLFASEFILMDMIRSHNETMILGRPYLATIHAEINIFNKEISLGIGDDRITFDMDKKIYNFATPLGKFYMVNFIRNDESPDLPNVSSRASLI